MLKGRVLVNSRDSPCTRSWQRLLKIDDQGHILRGPLCKLLSSDILNTYLRWQSSIYQQLRKFLRSLRNLGCDKTLQSAIKHKV